MQEELFCDLSMFIDSTFESKISLRFKPYKFRTNPNQKYLVAYFSTYFLGCLMDVRLLDLYFVYVFGET